MQEFGELCLFVQIEPGIGRAPRAAPRRAEHAVVVVLSRNPDGALL
jgi:hypothetical protein